MKKKILIVIVLILVILFIFFIIGNKKSRENGNISNMGLVCGDGNATYYNKYEKGIFISQNGIEKQLTDETAYSLNLVKGKLYYITVQDFNDVVIKSIDTNGENEKTLATIYTTISKIFVDGNYIYYATNETDKGIARVNLNGENEEIVLTESVQDFQVSDGNIYYVNNSNQIVKKVVNKDESVILKEEAATRKIQVVDNWIYYYNRQENALFRVKTNGKKTELISVLIHNEIYNISGKYVYYFDKENLKIAKMRIGKSNKCQDIAQISITKTKINIAGDEIYYLDKSMDETQTYQIFRIKNNGKEIKNIEY